jgi:DNA primase
MDPSESGEVFLAFTRSDHDALIAHYTRVAPLLVETFGAIPIVSGFVPDWNSGKAVFEGLIDKPVPPSIATVEVQTTRRTGRYIALAENALLWQAHRGALEFLSWTPVIGNPEAAAWARILLSPSGTATQAIVKEAAFHLRDALAAQEIGCVPVMGGVDGISLWIPFSDAPAYPALRAWLHSIANAAEVAEPNLFSVERPLAERGNRVNVAVESNAPGRYSALPYSLRGYDGLPMVTPVTWEEVMSFNNGDENAFTSERRVAEHDNVLLAARAPFLKQRAGEVVARAASASPPVMLVVSIEIEPRGRIVQAALAILADGKPRTADELLAEALARPDSGQHDA